MSQWDQQRVQQEALNELDDGYARGGQPLQTYGNSGYGGYNTDAAARPMDPMYEREQQTLKDLQKQ